MNSLTDRPKTRQARNIDNVMNSALWHLSQRDLTESELRKKLTNKTENQEWIDSTVSRLFELGYVKTDIEFAIRFAESRFFGDYGAGYIAKKLKDKGLASSVIETAIEKVVEEKQIDQQAVLTRYVLSYYTQFTVSREKLYDTLQKRGFTFEQVKNAVAEHPASGTLKSKLELKAEKVDLTKEVLTYARKGKGLTAIRIELRNRKVDVSSLDECVSELINNEQLDFYANCLQQLEKKRFDLNDYQEKSKAYGYLSRRGYSTDEIKYALEAAMEND
ncbi:RecX family transcriptional regulator [Vibrio parahaemolyticus]|uniref:RecX family transcriptional regulator n=1 Tax=Vibrio parahaemolyticus TaxID=670 RepID=UPI0008133F84|nr:RecX family transcriptional regulator [Vibrio parahaemolyticus]OCP68337.1 recombinase A [Vibrio parahaemolyticus]